MIEPAKFALFVGVSWALIIAPGPDMLYVITRGMAHGRRAGMLSAIGVVCGILNSYDRCCIWANADHPDLGIHFSLN